MHITEAVELFAIEKAGFTRKTRRFYQQSLRDFTRWCQARGLVGVGHLQPLHMTYYQEWLRTRPNEKTDGQLSDNTLHHRAQVLKTFMAWCCDEEDLRADRFLKRIVMPRREGKVLTVFSPEQITALMHATGRELTATLAARDKAILAVLLDTGIRANELCTLTLDRTFLSGTDSYLRVYGKGRKEREVGLGREARTAVQRYVIRFRPKGAACRETFLNQRSQPITPEGLDKILYRLRDWARIRGVRCSAHTFRHTFAVTYLTAGGDIYTLSQLLGHSSVATTEGYLRAFSSRQARLHGTSVLDSLGQSG
jgi:integrase/recombinase XerD